MSKPRLPARKLILSGLNAKEPCRYTDYNLTDGITVNAVDIKPPKELSKEAKKAFTTTVKPLLQMKVLSETDLVNLGNLFMLYDEVVKAKKAIAEFDKKYPYPPVELIKDRRALNAWLLNSTKDFIVLSGKFGMTPADRTRLPVVPEEENKDPLETVLEGV